MKTTWLRKGKEKEKEREKGYMYIRTWLPGAVSESLTRWWPPRSLMGLSRRISNRWHAAPVCSRAPFGAGIGLVLGLQQPLRAVWCLPWTRILHPSYVSTGDPVELVSTDFFSGLATPARVPPTPCNGLTPSLQTSFRTFIWSTSDMYIGWTRRRLWKNFFLYKWFLVSADVQEYFKCIVIGKML